MIQVLDVHKQLGDVWVLRGVDLCVQDGQTIAIVGPSGCGKSVLLRHIIGLLVPDRGDILIDGRSIARANYHELPEFRRRMGYVFQDSALLDSWTVRENLRMALDDAACERDPDFAPKRIAHTLALVNLDEEVLERLPGDLSGGMRKRVGVARAIINEPTLILYDEPATGLDPNNAAAINQIILRTHARLGATSIVVTHNVASMMDIADRVVLLDEGRIAFEAAPHEFLESRDPRVAGFLGSGFLGAVKEATWHTTPVAAAS